MRSNVDLETINGIFYNFKDHISKKDVKNILFMLDCDGKITHVDNHWCSELGYNKDDIVGKHFMPFIHAKDLDKFSKIFRHHTKHGVKLKKLRHRVKHKNGSWKTLVTKTSIIKDHKGEVVGVLAVSKELHSKKAQTGIGILIIFIATILVSAITSGILIKTSSTLQSKALIGGERSATQVATAIQTVTLSATNGADKNIEYFEHRVSVASVGEPVNLQELSITLDLTNASANLIYRDGECDRNETGGFYTNASSSDGYFTVRYFSRGPNWGEGFLQMGDLAQLCYEAPRSLDPGEYVRVRLIPKIGNILDIQTYAPDIISTQRVILI